ncbi:MAG: hypothetical protein K9N23_20235 [Akkermansiaceae bacterium]|nr:hypothetical protein [Akkermansiaceae bacterium]
MMAVIKPAITLLLALVFQLVQVMPVATAAAPSQTNAATCDCGCGSGGACPCARESAPVQKPPPAPLPSGSTLKPQPVPVPETIVRVIPIRMSPPPAGTRAAPLTGVAVGFHGVSLAVAFCSFVI